MEGYHVGKGKKLNTTKLKTEILRNSEACCTKEEKKLQEKRKRN
jgi:hypothetical protein